MTSEEFLCPNCRAVLKKSAAAQVLGKDPKVCDTLPSTVKCPNCGGLIATRSMMKGFFDLKKPQPAKRVLRLALFVFGILLVAAVAGRMAVLFLGVLRLAVFVLAAVAVVMLLVRLLRRRPD
jgi:predicted RNA-binding Zn-ribbon protein involved in translation (DUF1610 family)